MMAHTLLYWQGGGTLPICGWLFQGSIESSGLGMLKWWEDGDEDGEEGSAEGEEEGAEEDQEQS